MAPKPKNPVDRFWSHVEKTDSCWNWSGKTRGRFRLGGKKDPVVSPYRYAFELLVGEIPKGMLICHKCDNPRCVNPDHLFIGTARDNTKDMYSKGRGVNNRGENCGTSKLTEKDVLEIRELVKWGVSKPRISTVYSVSTRQVYAVLRRENWSHVNL